MPWTLAFQQVRLHWPPASQFHPLRSLRGMEMGTTDWRRELPLIDPEQLDYQLHDGLGVL